MHRESPNETLNHNRDINLEKKYFSLKTQQRLINEIQVFLGENERGGEEERERTLFMLSAYHTRKTPMNLLYFEFRLSFQLKIWLVRVDESFFSLLP